MLLPKKTKFNKQFKGKFKNKTYRGNRLIFGNYALKSLNLANITSKQIEAGRKIIIKKMKRLGFLWVRVFPDTPVTKKPNEVRMGKGKGSVNHWVSKIQKGQIIYEISSLSKKSAVNALISGSHKLPILTKIISKGAYSFNG